MRILCISAQKPDSTGSGVYLAETVASLAAAGHQLAVIAGIDKDDSPQLALGVGIPATEASDARVETLAAALQAAAHQLTNPFSAAAGRG